MSSTLLAPAQWAQMEFGSAQLGDERRTRRLVCVAGALAQQPSGTLPQAMPDWAALKAAYRLFSNEEITYERILTPHWEKTSALCGQPGEFLIIEDTTMLDFTGRHAIEGMGRLTRDEWSLGLLLHTTLALRVEAWNLEQAPEVTVLGLLDQQCWTRPMEKLSKTKSRKLMFRRPRESQRWARVFDKRAAPPHSQWTFIADRESDIYEVFARCNEARLDFIIRAAHPRALDGKDQTVFSAVEAGAPLGTFEVELRKRGDTGARRAKLEVRSATVTIRGTWRPGGKTAPFELNVVSVKEVDAPAGQEIEWTLLTSLPCEHLSQVRRIVGRYTQRWLIEEYHKALKTGAQIERSQLATAQRIQSVLAVCAVIALRLLNTKLLARATVETIVDRDHFGPEMITILTARFGEPDGGWTYRKVLVAMARMGGFLARKNDGDPGWITIWRGWHQLQTMAQGVRLLMKCG